MEICINQQNHIRETLANFKERGNYALGQVKGTKSITAGEEGVLMSCTEVMGEAITNPSGGCCINLPTRFRDKTSGAEKNIIRRAHI